MPSARRDWKLLEANESLRSTQQALRHTIYAARLNAAQSAWEADNINHCREMLEATRPSPGEADLRGFEWHYWRNRFRPALFTLQGQQTPVMSVVFSRDGRRIATAGGEVRLGTPRPASPCSRRSARRT